jgi:polyisoprenyl-phosphate glycosyltransferase
MSSISVVVPVYQSEESIGELHRRLTVVLKSLVPSYEILLVEDGGRDRTWALIEELCRVDKSVRGIHFSRNFGQHYGITAGLDHCCGDWVVIMDGDLQDRPEDIPALYAKALEGFDIVLAVRNARHQPLHLRFMVWVFYAVFNYLIDSPYDSRVGNFRIINRAVVENFRRLHEQLRLFGALVQWMGYRVALVNVEHDRRPYGKTAYNIRSLLILGFNTVIAYSDKPLRLSIAFGFATVLGSVVFGAYVVWRALVYGVPVMGWSSLMVMMCFFFGVVIINLGIIGIYVGKVFNEAKRRPLYLVREKLNFE